MDKEQAMLLEELALFQSRLEGRPISTEEAMSLTMEQLIDSLFPVGMPAPLDAVPLVTHTQHGRFCPNPGPNPIFNSSP